MPARRGPATDERQTVVTNRRARKDYHIEDTLEAGLKLTGTEVKSLRLGRASLQDAYAAVENGEIWLFNMHIAAYEPAGRFNHQPKRRRKMLLHRKEIDYLFGRTRERGYTLIPLRVYFHHGWAKVDIAVAKGKRQYDKREDMKKREAERRIRRALRERR